MSTIWDESYPPSLFAPPVITPTGAVAGTPGHWTPSGAQAPATLAEANALGLSLGPAWTGLTYVPLSPTGSVYWTGGAFALGVAPGLANEPTGDSPRRGRRKAEEGDH